jgi:hypothetical protein
MVFTVLRILDTQLLKFYSSLTDTIPDKTVEY